jgi:hypothetical protein
MNRETDVEMNNTGAAKMANNSGNADGTAPTPVELQGYDAVDSVMRGIPHSKPTQFAHISSSSFLITSLLTPPPPLILPLFHSYQSPFWPSNSAGTLPLIPRFLLSFGR